MLERRGSSCSSIGTAPTDRNARLGARRHNPIAMAAPTTTSAISPDNPRDRHGEHDTHDDGGHRGGDGAEHDGATPVRRHLAGEDLGRAETRAAPARARRPQALPPRPPSPPRLGTARRPVARYSVRSAARCWVGFQNVGGTHPPDRSRHPCVGPYLDSSSRPWLSRLRLHPRRPCRCCHRLSRRRQTRSCSGSGSDCGFGCGFCSHHRRRRPDRPNRRWHHPDHPNRRWHHPDHPNRRWHHPDPNRRPPLANRHRWREPASGRCRFRRPSGRQPTAVPATPRAVRTCRTLVP